jgi:hypothetical protein
MVVDASIDDTLIKTKGSLDRHRRQVGKDYDLLCQNQMSVEVDKCVIEQLEGSFLGLIVSGNAIQMDPAKAPDIVDWPRPTNQDEV